jgi:serine/threonine-protein kinase
VCDHSQILNNKDDQQFADLISKLADGFGRGEEYVLDDVCAHYPEFSKDLRLLWGTIAITRSAGKQQQNKSTQLITRFDAPESGLELPFDLGNYRLEQEIGRGGMGIVK